MKLDEAFESANGKQLITPKERQLLSEFNKDSETVFGQDDTCYEHYKEMQREVK